MSEGVRLNRGAPWSTVVFAVAFGYFEAAAVVYLKRLEALGQLTVGQNPFDNRLILIEVGREAASLALLAAWAWAAGRTRGERLAHFALAFGIWDVFFYVFLRWAIGWPERILEWDVLFLIPAPWYGPVVTPILVSALLIVGGWWVIIAERRGGRLRLGAASLSLLASGCTAILASFLWNHTVSIPFPASFPWAVFWIGWLLAAAGTVVVLRSLEKGTGETR